MNVGVTDKPSILKKVCYIVVLCALALIFTASAMMKFTNADEIINNFSKWGLLEWKEVIGGVEILAVLLYLFPKTNLIGILLLTAIMSGAIYIHATHDEPFFFNVSIIVVTWLNYLFLKPKK